MKKIKIDDYTVSPTESFLFDTNVWLFIYGPIASSEIKKQKKYSSLLSDILSRKAGLYITSLVVAEYINRVLRIGFEQWRREDYENRKNALFKQDYRKTEHYDSVLKDAIAQMTEILQCAKQHPDDFHRIDMNQMLNRLNKDCDYNDAYLVKCCELSNFKFVSDDKDIAAADSKITLITI